VLQHCHRWQEESGKTEGRVSVYKRRAIELCPLTLHTPGESMSDICKKSKPELKIGGHDSYKGMEREKRKGESANSTRNRVEKKPVYVGQ